MDKRWTALGHSHTFEPVVAPGYVIVGGTAGLHMLDRETGMARALWRPGGAVYSPAVDQGVAFVTDRQGRVAAIDVPDGRIAWERRLDGWLYTPAVVGGLIITGGQSGIVYALDRATGDTVWKRSMDQELVFRPVPVDDGVIVTTFAGTVARISQHGRPVWTRSDPSPCFSPEVAGDLLVFGGMDGQLRARALSSGDLLWTVELSGKLSAPATIRRREVAITSPDGELVIVDASDGRLLSRTPLSGAPEGSPVSVGQVWRAFYRKSGIISWVDTSYSQGVR